MTNEKVCNKSINYYVYRIYIFLLYPNLVYTFVVEIMIKKFLIMIMWMGCVSGVVIFLDHHIVLPDEVSGVVYFLSIGIAASSVLNYYK